MLNERCLVVFCPWYNAFSLKRLWVFRRVLWNKMYSCYSSYYKLPLYVVHTAAVPVADFETLWDWDSVLVSAVCLSEDYVPLSTLLASVFRVERTSIRFSPGAQHMKSHLDCYTCEDLSRQQGSWTVTWKMPKCNKNTRKQYKCVCVCNLQCDALIDYDNEWNSEGLVFTHAGAQLPESWLFILMSLFFFLF